MNLAMAGCGCNAAIYGVSMPARNSAGAVIPSGNGDGYCDANWVGGAACPEMDWMEANTAAWSTTPHTCVASANGYYGSCDGGGCGRYAYKNLGPSAYGYGAGYTIDTSQSFNVAVSFVPDAAGTLQSIVTLLTQGTRSISLVHDSTTCAAGYLATMSASIAAGMVPTLSLWGDAGSTMAWLDSPPCNTAVACSASATATFSNFAISRYIAPPSASSTPGGTPSSTRTRTPAASSTPSNTPPVSITASNTPTPVSTPSNTATHTGSASNSPTASWSRGASQSVTRSPAMAQTGSWGATGCVGGLSVAMDGASQVWQVVGTAWGKASTSGGRSVTLSQGDRVYLVSACAAGAFSPSMYHDRFPLLGKQLSYTVNLAAAGCGCNAAFYGVAMPGMTTAGAADATGFGDGYCDASCSSGSWCPEYGLQGANTGALVSSVRACSAPGAGGSYSWSECGSSPGCFAEAHASSGASAYGPGAGYTIDTSQPFTVTTAFPQGPGGSLLSVTTTLSQAGRSVVMAHTDASCGAEKLSQMAVSLANGLVPVLSLQGAQGTVGGMLATGVCASGGSCSAAASVTFSDVALTTLAVPSFPTPSPKLPSGTPSGTGTRAPAVSASGSASASASSTHTRGLTPSGTPSKPVAPSATPSVSQAASGQAGTWNAASCGGAVSVTIDGSVQTWQVAGFAWGKAAASGGASVSLSAGDRAYLVKSCSGAFSPSMYSQRFMLLGRALSYTVNLAAAGCGCNAAFFTVPMPGKNEVGQPYAGGYGDGYCDATCSGGTWCPELDVQGANTGGFASSVRACLAPSALGYYRWEECGSNAGCHNATGLLAGNAYGPGAGFTIDSTQPFAVTSFYPVTSAGVLASITTVLSQAGRSVTVSHTDAACGAGYLKLMSATLAAGVVPTMSLGNAANTAATLLATGACAASGAAAQCVASGAVTFSNFALTPLQTSTLSTSVTLTLASSSGALNFEALKLQPTALLAVALAMRCDIAAALGVPVAKVALKWVGPASVSGSTTAPASSTSSAVTAAAAGAIAATSISPTLNTVAIMCPYSAPAATGVMGGFLLSARRLQTAGSDTSTTSSASVATGVSGLVLGLEADVPSMGDDDAAAASLAAALLSDTGGAAHGVVEAFAASLGVAATEIQVSAAAAAGPAPDVAAPGDGGSATTPVSAEASGSSGGAAGGVLGLGLPATVGIGAAAAALLVGGVVVAAVVARNRRRGGSVRLMLGTGRAAAASPSPSAMARRGGGAEAQDWTVNAVAPAAANVRRSGTRGSVAARGGGGGGGGGSSLSQSNPLLVMSLSLPGTATTDETSASPASAAAAASSPQDRAHSRRSYAPSTVARGAAASSGDRKSHSFK